MCVGWLGFTRNENACTCPILWRLFFFIYNYVHPLLQKPRAILCHKFISLNRPALWFLGIRYRNYTITARDHPCFTRYSFSSPANWCTTLDTTNVFQLAQPECLLLQQPTLCIERQRSGTARPQKTSGPRGGSSDASVQC